MPKSLARWTHRGARSVLIASLLLNALMLSGVEARERPALGLGGVGLEIGVVSPEHADLAPQFGGVVHLGSVFQPWLHLTTGVSYWTTDIDRKELGSAVTGSISDLAIRTDLRWEVGRLFGLYPYIATGLAAHNVSADVPDDRSIERALSGLNWGFDAGLGVMSAARGFRYGVELRRRFVNDVDGWTATASFGWFFPRSRKARPYELASPRRLQGTNEYVIAAAPQAAAAPSVSSVELARLTDLLRDVVQLTRAQRAELDSLRQHVSALSAKAESARKLPDAALTPAAPAPAPPEPVPQDPVASPSRLDALRQALVRAAELTGHSDALRETGDGLLLVLPGTLLFGTASSDLQIESRETLRRIALVLMRYPDVLVSIEGHADSRGDPAFNLKLSRDRADAVARELAGQGIDARRLTVLGMGITAPIADNDTAAGRALNRRVELRFRFESPARRGAGTVG